MVSRVSLEEVVEKPSRLTTSSPRLVVHQQPWSPLANRILGQRCDWLHQCSDLWFLSRSLNTDEPINLVLTSVPFLTPQIFFFFSMENLGVRKWKGRQIQRFPRELVVEEDEADSRLSGFLFYSFSRCISSDVREDKDPTSRWAQRLAWKQQSWAQRM